MVNRTHDPRARSWVDSANAAGTDFPIQNLPFGVFSRRDAPEAPRVGVAIGSFVLDVSACQSDGLFDGDAARAADACSSSTLNSVMTLSRPDWSALRLALHDVLSAHHPEAARHRRIAGAHLVPQQEIGLSLPASIGDFTDFYASVFHATNVGRMFRPDHPLLDNYKYVPIGYHGRASSVVTSGTPVVRPLGQLRPDPASPPVFAPARRLDYEAEVGAFIGPGNQQGSPFTLADVDDHLFGLCLVNDWSARDIQQWEYQPLGPFLAKSFATTVSPWVVTMEALEPFRRPPFERPAGDPAPLDYLDAASNREHGGIDLAIEVYLQSGGMREARMEPVRVSRGSLADLYWTIGQLATHHASNGCNLRPGDLLATGTVSGPDRSSWGCLLELTGRGSDPLTLPTGERRTFLEDGDEVILTGRCERRGAATIGFGECRGRVVPARA